MAYVPPKGFVSGYAGAKLPRQLPKPPVKKPPKKVGAFDPYQSTDIDSIVNYLAQLQASGPDYRGITPPPSSEALQQEALTQSAWQLMPAQLQYERQQMQSRSGRETSQQAATAFTQALSEILQGGKTGDEGMAYAKENYGGSYLGVIAAQMGADLFRQITHDFDRQDFELADKLGTVMAQQPEIMQKVYDSLVETEQARVKGQMQDAETDYKNRVQALGFRIGELRKSEKVALDAAEASGDAPGKPRVFQTSEGIFAIDEATGQVVWEKKTGKAKTTKTTTQVVEQPDGSKVLINKTNGKQIAVVAPPDPAEAAGVSPSTLSNTFKRATAAGTAALEKVTENIWNRSGNPAPTIKTVDKETGKTIVVDNPAFIKANAAYQKFLDSGKPFGTAMYRVITAISPHLRALGYTKAQIKRAAYDIVSAEIDPPKGYKPPKASAARVAASNTAPTLDFGSLSRSTVGKVGQDLGGPEAHHARPLGNWQSDNAWDIGIPIGTPIYAITDGVVGPDVGSMASRPGDGQRLTLSAADNAYWYGHLSRISVKPGQRVKAGQLLGYSGASSNGAAHLHLGVRDLGGNYS